MSRLYKNYQYLKENEADSDKTLYLFKSGIFFILLAEDAKIASNLLNLKITYLTSEIVKCGFPVQSLEKYKNLIERTPYQFKIIDNITNTNYTLKDYFISEKIKKLLLDIDSVDTDSLSIKEAYQFIELIKESAQSIIGKDNKNANE